MSTTTGPNWVVVARREIMAKLTDRAFIIGTLVTLGMISGLLVVQTVLQERTQSYDVAVTKAESSIAAGLPEQAHAANDKVTIKVQEVADAQAATSAVRSGDADAWLHKQGDNWTLTSKSEVNSTLSGAVEPAIRGQALAANAAAAGTTPEALAKGSQLTTGVLEGDTAEQGFAQIVGFAMAFLFYIASLSFGLALAGSVVEEKANRIVEIIATKIPVRNLLFGKVAGNLVLALGQMALFVGIGLIGLSFTQYSSYLPSIGAGVGWFLAFFLVGFLLISCLWAVAGALASRNEDLQQTALPMSMGMVAVFFSSFLAKGSVLVGLSYVPPFSAILMPMRLVAGTASWWEPIIAMALLLVAALLVVRVAERLYKRSLLQTQGKLSIKQAWSTPT